MSFKQVKNLFKLLYIKRARHDIYINCLASNTRKRDEKKQKKAEVIEEVKSYLNSEILREPRNIHKFNLF